MQLHTEKYNVAWFKLAEFILRGEKERALGIYRLLAHSLQNQALAVQLKADILLSFADERAIEEYNTAAKMYQKQKKFMQTAAIYEHICMLSLDISKDIKFLIKLLAIYSILDWQNKVSHTAKKIVKLLIETKDFSKFDLYLNSQEFLDEFCLEVKLDIQQSSLLAYCQENEKLDPYAYHLIEEIIKFCKNLKIDNQNFLSKLKLISQKAYDYALTC